jgi:hypothetical protein
MKWTRELWFALVLAAATPAIAGAELLDPDAVEPRRPGPVVVDVRGRVAVGYGFGQWASLGLEPDVLFLRPSGRGIGIDLGFDAVGNSSSVGSGGMFVAGLGLKYAVMRRIGSSPLFCKSGAGVGLLFDTYGGVGARVRLEGGISPVAGQLVAFPVEGVLTAEVYGSGGAALMLGLSVGAGWIFAGGGER